MKAILGTLVPALWLAGCAPPPATPPARKPAQVRIGTPTETVFTPALKALQHAPQDSQLLVRVTVQADGRVSAARAEYTQLSPSEINTVLTAVQQWRFKPAQAGGQAVAADFIYPLFFGPDAAQQRTVFLCRNQAAVYSPPRHCEIVTSGGWRIYRFDPVYPPDLLDQRLSGTVTLGFDIGPNGRAVNPKVVEAQPTGRFDAAAIAAVKFWYFEPVDSNAGADAHTQKAHVTVSVHFTPPPPAAPLP